MIKIIAKSTVLETKLEEYKALARELVEKSQAEEGCIEYNLWQSPDNPAVLTMVEGWRDQQSIDKHNASEHFLRIVPQLRALRKEISVEKYVLA